MERKKRKKERKKERKNENPILKKEKISKERKKERKAKRNKALSHLPNVHWNYFTLIVTIFYIRKKNNNLLPDVEI